MDLLRLKMPANENAKGDKYKRRIFLSAGYICMCLILGYFVLDIFCRVNYKTDLYSAIDEELNTARKDNAKASIPFFDR